MAKITTKKHPASRLAQFWPGQRPAGYCTLTSILLCLFFLNSSTLDAQTVTGTIKDGITKQVIDGVAIRNKRTNDLYYSDPSGNFIIYATPGDTLKFVQLGYFDYEYVVATKTGDIGIIRLTQNKEILDTVSIAKPLTAYQNDSIDRLKTFRRQLNQAKESFKVYNHKYIVKPNFGLTFDGIISSLFQRMSRKYRRLWKFQKRFYRPEEMLYINSRYNKGIVQNLTGLDDKEADDFMEQYRMDKDFITAATEMEIEMRILYDYRQWKQRTLSPPDTILKAQ